MKPFFLPLVRRWLLALVSVVPLAVTAQTVDCGDKPISLAYFEFGIMYFEQHGQSRGIDKDLVTELSRRTGCRFTTLVMPRSRVWEDLASGALDMSVSAIQTPEREQFAWFAPYALAKNYAVIRTDIAAGIQDGHGFALKEQLQFGVVRGFKHGQALDLWLDDLRKSGRVQESAHSGLLFEKLKQGHIDAMFAQPILFRKFLDELGIEGKVTIQDWNLGDKGVTGNLIMAKHRFSREQAGKWQQILGEIRRDGTLERIFRRYVSPAEAAQMIRF